MCITCVVIYEVIEKPCLRLQVTTGINGLLFISGNRIKIIGNHDSANLQ